MKEFIEGALAISKTVKLCRPGVISAYPITPQTHIVEGLAQLIADGELDAEFINVESEHSAASVVLGASATGIRAYSASSSQGLLLMAEVLFNIAGMRLPLTFCCVNRSVSAPINIWNDHQDSMTVRDSGWIQMFAENIQEACDLHIMGYRISEDNRILLPVMVCIDGYLLSHAYEPVELPLQEDVDKFLPPYNLSYKLDTKNPLTLGVLADPMYYLETRYAIQETMKNVVPVINETTENFVKIFGRSIIPPIVERYKTDDAQTIVIAMGTLCGTIKDTIDELRLEGEKIGLLKIILYRPLPKKEIIDTLKTAKRIIVIDKSISLGAFSPLYEDIVAILNSPDDNGNKLKEYPEISSFIAGLGGRDITKDDIRQIIKESKKQVITKFVGLKETNLFTDIKDV